MVIAIITILIGNCPISSKGSIIYLSPYSFQSLSLIISITANISGINKQSQKLTLCADGRASLPYIKTPPGEPDGAFDLDLRVVLLDSCLCCKRHIAPTISYPHAHIQIHPLIDSPAGRKAVDIPLRIVDGQCKGTDFDVVIRVKFAFCLVSGSQIPAKLIL